MNIETKSIGKVITFYSFKGGVGRTMSLSNVAALLAKWGKKVLIVDFDLEAPGVEKYFTGHDFAFSTNRTDCFGIVDLLTSIHNMDEEIKWKDCLMNVSSFTNNLQCDILPAGKDNPDYTAKLQNLDWDFLFENRNFSEILEQVRTEWKETYDYVLVDSRTGISDIGGICTIYLPDIIAFLFTTNEVSLSGCIDVINRAKESRVKLPYDRNSLITIPIPSRDESKSEFESALKWKEVFSVRLEPLFKDWLPKDTNVKSAIDILKIPYIPYWSFGDRLPVIEEGTSENSIGYAYEKIALLILGNFDWQKVKVGFTTDDIENNKNISLKFERKKFEDERKDLELKIEMEKNRSKKVRRYTLLIFSILAFSALIFNYTFPWDKYSFIQQLELYPSIEEQYQAQGGDIDSIRSLEVDVNNYPFLKDKFGLFENLDTLIFKSIRFKDFNDFNSVEKIKRLDISSCSFNNFTGIDKFSSLQILLLTNNNSLKNLSGIEKLSSLTSLMISSNSSLQNLSGVEGLTALETLNIFRNQNLSNLSGIKELTSLKSLTLLDNSKIINLSDISNLNTLQSLKIGISDEYFRFLSKRDTLTSINEIDFSKLLNLNSVEISGNYNFKDFEFIRGLEKLDTLRVSNNNIVKSIGNFGKYNDIKYLTLSNLTALNNLQGIEVLNSLEFLSITNEPFLDDDLLSSRKIISLHLLHKLKKLQTLHISGNFNFVDFKLIGNNSSFRSLSISNNFNLKSLSWLKSLKYLEKFSISYCYGINSLVGIEMLKNLKSLTIINNFRLKDLYPIKSISTLEQLSITNNFTSIPISFEDLKELKKLKSLKHNGNLGSINLQGIDYLTSLDSLTITNNEKLINLEGIENNFPLKYLSLSDNDSLQNLNGIGKLKSLENLTIETNTKLTDIRGIEILKSLKSLKIKNNADLENIDGIESINSLEYLTIRNQQKVKINSPSLAKSKKLKILNISSDMQVDYKVLKKHIPNLKLIRRNSNLSLTEIFE